MLGRDSATPPMPPAIRAIIKSNWAALDPEGSPQVKGEGPGEGKGRWFHPNPSAPY